MLKKIKNLGSDCQALIWQMSHTHKDEPILAYSAEGEVFIFIIIIKINKYKNFKINQIHWANNFNQWICITFNNNLEILRV